MGLGEEVRYILAVMLPMTMDAHARQLADVVELLRSSLSELLSYGDGAWLTVSCGRCVCGRRVVRNQVAFVSAAVGVVMKVGVVSAATTDKAIEGALMDKAIEGALKGNTIENTLKGNTIENTLEGNTTENTLKGNTIENTLKGNTTENTLEDTTINNTTTSTPKPYQEEKQAIGYLIQRAEELGGSTWEEETNPSIPIVSLCRKETFLPDAFAYCLSCIAAWNLSGEPTATVLVTKWLLRLVEIASAHPQEATLLLHTCRTMEEVTRRSPDLSLLTVYDSMTKILLRVASFSKNPDEIESLYKVIQAELTSMRRDAAHATISRYEEYLVQSIFDQLSILTLYCCATSLLLTLVRCSHLHMIAALIPHFDPSRLFPYLHKLLAFSEGRLHDGETQEDAVALLDVVSAMIEACPQRAAQLLESEVVLGLDGCVYASRLLRKNDDAIRHSVMEYWELLLQLRPRLVSQYLACFYRRVSSEGLQVMDIRGPLLSLFRGHCCECSVCCEEESVVRRCLQCECVVCL